MMADKLKNISHQMKKKGMKWWEIEDTYVKDFMLQEELSNLKGEKGDKGSKGSIGKTGKQGKQGSRGDRGTTGKHGKVGSRGLTGKTGKTGLVGKQGKVGAQGPKGPKGDKGESGKPGPQGKTGPKGDKGDAGETGDVGMTFRGQYQSDTRYNKNDVVFYAGSSFIALEDNRNTAPSFTIDPRYRDNTWGILAIKGAQGGSGASSEQYVLVDGTRAMTGGLEIVGSADESQLTVSAHSTQTNPISIWEDDSGNAQITFSGIGGAVFNEQGNDADFRIEGDADTHLFFLDASEDTISMGTSDSSYVNDGATIYPKFLIQREAGPAKTSLVNRHFSDTFNEPPFLTLAKARAAETALVDGDWVGIFQFLGHDGTDYQGSTIIRGQVDDTVSTGVMPIGLLFLTGDAQSQQTSIVCHSGGNVGIRTTFASANFEVEGNTVFNQSGADVDFRVEGSGVANLFGIDGGLPAVRIGDAVAGSVADFRSTVITFNESGEDQNFRVETLNNTFMFHVDGGLDTVYIGTTVLGAIAIFGATSIVFNENGADQDFRIEGDTATNLFNCNAGLDSVQIGTTSAGAIAQFGPSLITFNETAQDQNFRVETVNNPFMFFVDAGIDAVHIGDAAAGTLAKISTAEINFNDAGADIDFRVEGDVDPNLLFVNAGTNRVGIGIAVPNDRLHVSNGSILKTGTTTVGSRIENARFSANNLGSINIMSKSRNATIGSHTVVQNGDILGLHTFQGSDGSSFVESAQIAAEVDGTPGAGDVPGLIRFLTQPAGGSLTNRFAVYSSGNIEFNAGTKTEGLVFRKTAEIQTTDATQTTVDGFVLLDENTYHLKARVVGVKSDGSERASYEIDATAYRTGAGVATLQGSVTSLHTQESDATWDATFTVNSNSVRVSVTGVAATTIEWVCVLEVINMSN